MEYEQKLEKVDEEEEPGSKRAKMEFDAGALDATCDSQSCVDQGVPCPPCAKQNKGIAACFAQGHLYLTLKGEVPSSCKDCKARNKGALFCFKRGHMVNLRAMLPCGAANGMCSTVKHLDADAIDDQSAVDHADDEDGEMGEENDFYYMSMSLLLRLISEKCLVYEDDQKTPIVSINSEYGKHWMLSHPFQQSTDPRICRLSNSTPDVFISDTNSSFELPWILF